MNLSPAYRSLHETKHLPTHQTTQSGARHIAQSERADQSVPVLSDTWYGG